MNPTYPSQSGTSTETLGGSTTPGIRTDNTAQDTYSEAKSAFKRTGSALRGELGNLKSDLDTLLGRAGDLSDYELSREHARLMAKFSSVKSAAKGVAAEANRQLSRGVDATSTYVQDKPLQSIAAAAGVGLVLGMLFKRR